MGIQGQLRSIPDGTPSPTGDMLDISSVPTTSPVSMISYSKKSKVSKSKASYSKASYSKASYSKKSKSDKSSEESFSPVPTADESFSPVPIADECIVCSNNPSESMLKKAKK